MHPTSCGFSNTCPPSETISQPQGHPYVLTCASTRLKRFQVRWSTPTIAPCGLKKKKKRSCVARFPEAWMALLRPHPETEPVPGCILAIWSLASRQHCEGADQWGGGLAWKLSPSALIGIACAVHVLAHPNRSTSLAASVQPLPPAPSRPPPWSSSLHLT